jgi:hypothetical protein
MLFITKENNPKLYQELFDARKAAVIEALILIHDLKIWLKKRIISMSNGRIKDDTFSYENIKQYIQEISENNTPEKNRSQSPLNWSTFYDNFCHLYEKPLEDYILSDTKEMQEKIKIYDRLQDRFFEICFSMDFIEDPNNSLRTDDKKIKTRISHKPLRQALDQEYAIITGNERYAEQVLVVIFGLMTILIASLAVIVSPYFFLLLAILMPVIFTNTLAGYPLRRYLDTQGVAVVSDDEMLAISQHGRDGIKKENTISLCDSGLFHNNEKNPTPHLVGEPVEDSAGRSP